MPTTAGELPPPTARDDVAFLSRVIDTVVGRLCGDPRRVYATGHSGGGRMTSALACRIADKLAAVAPNAGLRAGRPDPDDPTVPEVEDCEPQRPLPVLTFHGQQDMTNPYTGNGDLRWGYTVPVALQTWARIDGCRRGPNATPVSANVTRLAYTQCRDGVSVELYRVANGGHTWPGSDGPPHGGGLVDDRDRRVADHVGLLRALSPAPVSAGAASKMSIASAPTIDWSQARSSGSSVPARRRA